MVDVMMLRSKRTLCCHWRGGGALQSWDRYTCSAVQWSEFINFKELQSIDQEYATFFICQKVMDRSVWTCPMECGLMNYKELVKNMSYFYHCVRDCDFSFCFKKKIYQWNASWLSKELLAFFCKSIFFLCHNFCFYKKH